MRTILFRGKRIENGEWIYGHYFKYDETHNIVPDHYSAKPSGWHNVIPETVGQFTGLTDKNGVKIFEGDIVTNGSIQFKIEWNAQNTCFYATVIGRDMKDSFDIMDIMENQKLGNGYYSRKDLELIGTIND